MVVVREYMNGRVEIRSKNDSRWYDGTAGSKVIGSIREAMRVMGMDLSDISVLEWESVGISYSIATRRLANGVVRRMLSS